MSRRISKEQIILDFFRDEDLPVAESILRLCIAMVKSRRPKEEKPKAKRGRKPADATITEATN